MVSRHCVFSSMINRFESFEMWDATWRYRAVSKCTYKVESSNHAQFRDNI
jgi:hypothetical protein